jgi:hypothetical protein
MIAVSNFIISSQSLNREFASLLSNIQLSLNKINQYLVSLASLYAIESLALKSLLDDPPVASSTLAPMEVPDLTIELKDEILSSHHVNKYTILQFAAQTSGFYSTQHYP